MSDKVKKTGRRYATELLETTRDVTAAISTFKTTIFKSIMMGEAFDERDLDKLLSQFNSYLRTWDDYSQEISDGLKDCKTEDANVYTLDYSSIRDFVYANYDYPSVLQFADGVFKGVTSGKFKESEDIHDFFDHTVAKAFNNMSGGVAGVLDTFLEPDDETNVVDNLGFNHFKTIKNNHNLFQVRIRGDIYKSIKKTLEYLLNHIDELKKSTSYNDTRLLIASVNRILEYAQISATVYAARIYIIGAYCYPFIRVKAEMNAKVTDSDDAKKDAAIDESAKLMEEAAKNYDAAIYHVIHDMDDGKYRSPGETKGFIGIMSDFITDIGANDIIKNSLGRKPEYNRSYFSKSDLTGNKFCQPMMQNPIFYKISTVHERDLGIYSYKAFTDGSINEFAEMLKSSVYDREQALPTSGSDRQGILHIIRGVDVDKETVEDYKKLACDLYVCTIALCCGIENALHSVGEITQGVLQDPISTLPIANVGSECMRLLSYLYRDLSFACIQKARYIEYKINKLTEQQQKKIFNDLSISIPGKIDDEINMNDFMMVAVPDTTRVPVDLSDLYALPTFEALQIFDEFIKSDPYFENDVYFSEAFDMSSIINAITAAIQGCVDRFKAFWNNQAVQASVKWVTDHENDLKQLNFDGKSMKVLPFKTDAQGHEKIDIMKHVTPLQNTMASFRGQQQMTSKDAENFVKRLYGTDIIYKWFTDQNDSDGKLAAAKYRNLVLFAADERQVTDKTPDPITLQGNDLKARMNEWVDTVKGAKNALDAYIKISENLKQSVNTMKSHITSMTNPSTGTSSNNPDPAGKVENADKDKQEKPRNQQTQQNQQNTDQNQVLNTVLADTNKAIQRLWVSSVNMFIYYIKTEYNYIRDAYGIAQKPVQNQQPAQPANQ